MSSHMMSSGASAPTLAPPPGVVPPVPALVPPKPKRSRGRRWVGLIVFLLLAAIAIERGVHFVKNASPSAQKAAAAVIRTSPAQAGSIDRTVRLTGTTGAERFSSLISPQLRGNRSGAGRDGSSRGGSRGDAPVIRSNSRGSSGSSRVVPLLQLRPIRLRQPVPVRVPTRPVRRLRRHRVPL